MNAALATYGAALRRAASGVPTPIDLVRPGGEPAARLDADQWCESRPGDAGVVDRCAGPTLDVGCGPGRLAGVLTERGELCVGVDISAEAVRQAQRRGVTALRQDVFEALPGEGALPGRGRWRHVLLIDGNIGIGGDPVRLLRRCARLLRSDGDVLVEAGSPGSGTWCGPVHMHHAGETSDPFEWAAVAHEHLDVVAILAGLRLAHTWTEAGRWFGRLGQ